MIGRRGLALVFSCAGALALTAACVDLFHSTRFENECELDASAPGCLADSATDARPTDFCAWSPSEARSNALHACTWLGACSTPFDENAFGPCMVDAILAYDCETNPNRPVRGALHDYWDALWRADSCEGVTRALVPQPERCESVGFGCGAGEATGGVLFECATKDAMASPESCVVQGRACENGACVAPGASASCRASECVGTVLHDCEDGQDMGHDCQYFGAEACTGKGDAAACLPSDAGARCTPTPRATCDGGVATACASGRVESVDCERLTGRDSCRAGIPTPSWNLAEACQGDGGCTPGCAGDILTGCAQGAEFTATCSGEKLGACKTVPVVGTIAGNIDGYACAPPRN